MATEISGGRYGFLETVARDTAAAGDFIAFDGEVATMRREVELSAAEILDLFATPVEVIPTPGPRRYIVLTGARVVNVGGGTGYTVGVGRHLAISYSNPLIRIATVNAGTFMTNANVDWRHVAAPGPTLATDVQDFKPPEDSPVSVSVLVGQWTGGTNRMRVVLYYHIRPCGCD